MNFEKNQPFLVRLRFAVTGLRHGWRTERSLRAQALALCAALIALALIRPPAIWCGLVVLAGTCVIAAELFNTARERLADHLHPGRHPEIRAVKDAAAAAVLVLAAGAVAVAIALVLSRT